MEDKLQFAITIDKSTLKKKNLNSLWIIPLLTQVDRAIFRSYSSIMEHIFQVTILKNDKIDALLVQLPTSKSLHTELRPENTSFWKATRPARNHD